MYSVTKNKQFIIMSGFYFFAFVLCYVINQLLATEHEYNSGLNKFIYECLFSSETKISKLLTSSRGTEYYLTLPKYKYLNKKNCLVSMWAFTHLGLYTMIGLFCPDLFYCSLVVGILFELSEYITKDCHDILDVVFNTIGFGIGYQINRFFLKNKFSFRKSIYISGLVICAISLTMFARIIELSREA